MQPEQPEHPRRPGTELVVGPGEHSSDASRGIAAVQCVETAGPVAKLSGQGRQREMRPGGRDKPPPVSPDTEPAVELPVSLIPPALLAQANELLQQLNYPVMAGS